MTTAERDPIRRVPPPSSVPHPQPKPTPTAPKPSTGGGGAAPASAAGAAPLTAAGGTPVSKYEWALAFIRALGGTPTTGIINLVIAWIDKEGTPATWNPLAITNVDLPGSTRFNSVNVRNFTSFDQGVQATAHFIQNGHYNNIIAAIRTGDPNLAFAHLNEFNLWGGSSGYGESLVGIYRRVSGDPNAGASGLIAAGSGGGGPAAAAGASGVQQWILANDPSLDWALGIPELQTILANANVDSAQGQANLIAAIMGSDYYKNHGDQARKWAALQSTDRAEAERLLQAAQAHLRELAASLGITLSDAALAGLALGEMSMGWAQGGAEERQALLAASAFSQSNTLGSLGNGAIQAKQLFADYGIKLDDATAQQYGLQINVAGGASAQALENLRPIAIQQAKALFPSLGELLDQGVTVRNVFTPYQNAAAQLLEVDPSTIDLTDPKWNRALQGDQKQGSMSLDQWQSTVMTDPRYGWDRTGNAKSAAVNLTEQLGRSFGVSA